MVLALSKDDKLSLGLGVILKRDTRMRTRLLGHQKIQPEAGIIIVQGGDLQIGGHATFHGKTKTVAPPSPLDRHLLWKCLARF